MGRLNSNEPVSKGAEHDNIGFRMGRLVANEKTEPFDNDSLITQNVNNKNDTDTERDTDDGLLPKPTNAINEIDATGIDYDPEATSPFDVNLYQHKKTLAQGMMDLALFSANANQLRYVLELSPENRNIFFYMSLILILLSLLLQGMVGIGLIWNGRYNIKKSCDHHNANRANNMTLIGIFLITLINVFISAFGIPSSRPPGSALANRIGGDDTQIIDQNSNF